MALLFPKSFKACIDEYFSRNQSKATPLKTAKVSIVCHFKLLKLYLCVINITSPQGVDPDFLHTGENYLIGRSYHRKWYSCNCCVYCLLALVVTETCVRKIINWLVAVGRRWGGQKGAVGNKMYLLDLKGSEYYHWW